MSHESKPSNVLIRAFQPGDETAFRVLNEAWITRFFVLEEKDRLTLGDPEKYILKPGGQILFALLGDEIVGCCALMRMDAECFEIAKMAVDESVQGRGIGGLLMQGSIDLARRLGARRLYLETNSKLAPALRLYASFGFRRITDETLPPSPYARADVRMELRLD
jgi:GNAT superfamily N-acetyltransferase